MVFDDLCFGLEPVLIKSAGYDFFEKFGKKDYPILNGIYAILCNDNGMFYIGSTKNFKKRIKSHSDAMRRKGHRNKILNSCWAKYGGESFSWFWLEDVKGDQKELFLIEQLYLDFFQPWPENNGINLARLAIGVLVPSLTLEEREERSRLSHRFETPYQLRDPSGNIHSFYNISVFSEKNGLKESGIRRILVNRTGISMGWSIPSYKIPTYTLVSESGEICHFENMSEFSRDRNILVSSVSQVINGKLKSVSGWRLPGEKKKVYDNPEVRSPDGTIYKFESAAVFMREHKLSKSFKLLIKGYIKTFKGWSLAKDEPPIVRMVTFELPNGEDYETSDIGLFCKKFDCNSSNIFLLTKGEICQTKGIKLKSIEYKYLSDYKHIDGFENKFSIFTGKVVIKN
jgi:group I intron endonuclease